MLNFLIKDKCKKIMASAYQEYYPNYVKHIKYILSGVQHKTPYQKKEAILAEKQNYLDSVSQRIGHILLGADAKTRARRQLIITSLAAQNISISAGMEYYIMVYAFSGEEVSKIEIDRQNSIFESYIDMGLRQAGQPHPDSHKRGAQLPRTRSGNFGIKASNQKYTDWDRTPMAWHKFLLVVTMPLTILAAAGALLTYQTWTVDFCVFSVISGITAILAIIFSIKRNWIGPVLITATFGEAVIYSLFLFIVVLYFSAYEQLSTVLGSLIGSALFFALNIIYYKKRRPIFTKIKNFKAGTEAPYNIVGESSVDLLTHIMEEQEKENMAKPFSAAPYSKKQKQKFKAPVIILSILSGVLSIALIGSCVSLWNQSRNDINRLQGELNQLEIQYNARGDMLEDVREDRDAMREENNFYRRYACIVTESGEKYHRYGCPYLSDMTSFWIYNTEAAEGRGYEPCSNCYDHTFQDIYDQLEDILEAAREEDKTG